MKTIILAGTGRSGTTIAADVVNASGRYRFLFEPLYTKKVALFESLRPREYLASDKNYPEIEQLFDRLFDGEVGNEWTDRHPIPHSPQGLFIKLVRANLLLGWLKRRYPSMLPILMVRHPLSVTESRLRNGWPISLSTYTGQKVLTERYLAPFEHILSSCNSTFEQHVAAWCIETMVPIVELPLDSYFPLVYEQLVDQPEGTLFDLGNYLGTTFGDAELRRLARPSATSMKSSADAIKKGKKVTKRWMKAFSPVQIAAGMAIVEQFGLTSLYPFGPEAPNVNSFATARNEILTLLGRDDEVHAEQGEVYASPEIVEQGMTRPAQVDEAVTLAKRGMHRAAMARLERIGQDLGMSSMVRDAVREVEALSRTAAGSRSQQRIG